MTRTDQEREERAYVAWLMVRSAFIFTTDLITVVRAPGVGLKVPNFGGAGFAVFANFGVAYLYNHHTNGKNVMVHVSICLLIVV